MAELRQDAQALLQAMVGADARFHPDQFEAGYHSHRGCLMQFLIAALDDPAAAPCGRCQNCTGKALDFNVPAALMAEAEAFLAALTIKIRSRKRWPGGLVDGSTVIPKDSCNREGRALCFYGDAGLGKLVQAGKYRAKRYGDTLVDAAARLIADRWQPSPEIAWITAIPSRRHPALVPDFAERLAKRLDLPFNQVLGRVSDAPEQKAMATARSCRF